MGALVTDPMTLVSFDRHSPRSRTLEKQLTMRFLSASTSIRLAAIAFLLVGCPAIALAHPGHGGVGAGEQDHGQWVDGVLHSLIAVPVILSSMLLAVSVVASSMIRRWESLSWLGAAAIGCVFAAFHLNVEWTVWQQVSYLLGSSMGAVLWYAAGRLATGVVARQSAIKAISR
jgi:hypothetical protein